MDESPDCTLLVFSHSSGIEQSISSNRFQIILNNELATSIAAGAPLAPTVDALYHRLFPEVLGDPADAGGCKVVVSCLYAAEAAEALITWLQETREKIVSSAP